MRSAAVLFSTLALTTISSPATTQVSSDKELSKDAERIGFAARLEGPSIVFVVDLRRIKVARFLSNVGFTAQVYRKKDLLTELRFGGDEWELPVFEKGGYYKLAFDHGISGATRVEGRLSGELPGSGKACNPSSIKPRKAKIDKGPALRAPVRSVAIERKYKSLGGATGFLANSTSEVRTTPDSIAKYRLFEGGAIYSHPSFGTFEVHGLIWRKWGELGWEKSHLGYPVSDELDDQGGGKVSRFQNGTIRWHPERGVTVHPNQATPTNRTSGDK